MKALSIALKDIQIFLKDRGTLIQLFLLPMIFIVVYSAVASAFTGEDQDQRMPIYAINLDGGEGAEKLLAGLEKAGGVQVELIADEQGALQKLEASDIPWLLTIPADFSEGLSEGRTVTLRLTTHPSAGLESAEAVRLVVEGVA